MNKSLEIIKKYKLDYYLNCLITKNDGNVNLYHNYDHTMTVVKNIYLISKDIDLPDDIIRLLLISGIFHDFNHSGGKLKNDSKNVELAIEAFEKYTKENNSKNSVIISTIQSTQFPYDPNQKLNLNQQIIRDADVMQWLEDDFEQHVLFGLGYEMNDSNKLTITQLENQIKFMTSVEIFTDYAKNKIDKILPQKVEECEYLITILKNK